MQFQLGHEVGPLSGKVSVQPFGCLTKHGKISFFVFRTQRAGKILLAFEPQTGEACAVAGKNDFPRGER